MKGSNITKQNITDTLESNYMPYAMSVIVSRAIPEIDGFKPSHRKLLYSMYQMKLLTGQRTKSANVVGQTMKLNPHGDQAIYATLVRLTRGHDALLTPFIDSKGNFGKHTSRDMAYAASRYTEVKLAPICQDIFKDIDKDVVPFVDSYDGRMKEPSLLPTTFPNILVNANKGIAVGMASNICSYNLREVCDGTIAYLKNEEVDLFEHINAPDFSTGGQIIYDEKELRKIYDTGVGSVKIRSKYRYDKENNCIEVYEIPYTVTVEQIIEKILDLVKAGKIKDISDLRDETDLKGLKIAIDLKRGTNYELLMAKLFMMTPLEDSFPCNFNLLINGRPQVLGIKPILKEWVIFRKECIIRQLKYENIKMESKRHLLLGLEKVLMDIDKAIEIIRNTPEEIQVIPNLMEYFKIDDEQANYVADIKLRNLNKEYLLNKINEIADLNKHLEENYDLIQNAAKINKVIIQQLQEVKKKYGHDRFTDIIEIEKNERIQIEEIVENYPAKLFYTKHGYIKKVSIKSLRGNDVHKLKDEDEIISEIDTENVADLLLFSNKQNLYKYKISDIPDHKASVLGSYIPNLIELEEGEEIIFVTATLDYSGKLLFGYENGKISKIPLEVYATKTNRKKLIKAYSDISPLIKIIYLENDANIAVYRTQNKHEKTMLVVNSELITEKVTKNTQGIQVIRLKKGSIVSEIHIADEEFVKKYKSYIVENIPMAGKELKIKPKVEQIKLY